ncbi:hypothetical protein [Prauserella muralis]|uniref:Uncharacterized protein n=1 Tax=Prauserella muralis TaxID=588067 RepID=A0A2V4ALP4_9PSEU|nr:hypothetical protein [Prauserella muralis]PXY21152.1 hypothetical protein BAY60_27175 [Prauserella muralis]TWE30240.1 hypothetical protein FHX69_2937 [Prauserella muralis]
MTATLNGHALPDPATVLKRVDDRLARKAGDDPLPAETIDAFADAVRTQIVEPLTANPPDAAELAQLRADLQCANDIVAELRKQPFPWADPGPEQAPDHAPDEPQPWGELFARIRRELALAWADDRKGAR